MDPDVINKAIDEAVAEAKELGIHGKETTPFLLAKIKDITGGDSLWLPTFSWCTTMPSWPRKTACRADGSCQELSTLL